MQFSHAIIALAAASLASAQQIPPIPQCALSCFANTLTTDGCSGLTDYKCHCAKPQLVSEVTPCVQKNCSPADQSSASSIVVSICSSVGEPISVPPVSGGSSSAAASSTAAASSSMVSSAMSTSMASGCGGSTPMASSSPAPMSSAASSPASSSAVATSSAVVTASSTASASATQFTGAAVQNKGNLAGVAAIAAAAAYLL